MRGAAPAPQDRQRTDARRDRGGPSHARNPLEDGPRRLGIALARRLETPLRGHALQPRRELRTHADLRPRHGQRRGQRADRPLLGEQLARLERRRTHDPLPLRPQRLDAGVGDEPRGRRPAPALAARRRHRGLRHQPPRRQGVVRAPGTGLRPQVVGRVQGYAPLQSTYL